MMQSLVTVIPNDKGKKKKKKKLMRIIGIKCHCICHKLTDLALSLTAYIPKLI